MRTAASRGSVRTAAADLASGNGAMMEFARTLRYEAAMKTTPAIALMTTAATAAWLALAIYARGGFVFFSPTRR